MVLILMKRGTILFVVIHPKYFFTVQREVNRFLNLKQLQIFIITVQYFFFDNLLSLKFGI